MYQANLFHGKHILVTGGRSGIGYVIAQKYLTLGASVTIASRKKDLLEEAVVALSAYGKCDGFPCDIRNAEDVSNLAEQIKKIHARLDILVNNAGGQFPAPAELISKKGWAAVVNNNLNGTFYVSQDMSNHFFIPQKHGIIVNIIANMFRGFPGMAHTGAARAGVENLTKTLSQEWAEYNIRVNAVAPGIIESSGLDQYPPQMVAFFDDMKKKNLMGRFGTPEDVANAVLFLSCPLSSYVSGSTLYVDGTDHLSANPMDLYKVLKSSMSN